MTRWKSPRLCLRSDLPRGKDIYAILPHPLSRTAPVLHVTQLPTLISALSSRLPFATTDSSPFTFYRSTAVDVTLMTVYRRRDRVTLSERVDACQIASVADVHPGARDQAATADYATCRSRDTREYGKKTRGREDETIKRKEEPI